MNFNFIKPSILSFGLLSVVSLAALPVSSKPAVAQTLFAIAADGQLNEYSSRTAPILKRGIVSEDVADIQILLNELGFYDGKINSTYDAQTSSSVIKFQRSRNLTANGVVDSPTWRALIDASNRIAGRIH